MKTCVIDVGVNNIDSIVSVLNYLGNAPVVSSDPMDVVESEKIIFPGVGNFDFVSQKLKEKKLDSALKEAYFKGVDILSICLGMQLFAKSSSEGKGRSIGLGIINAEVDSLKFLNKKEEFKYKVPHTGYNEKLSFQRPLALLRNIEEFTFYYNHSYGIFKIEDSDISINYSMTRHNNDFVSIIEKKNLFCVQFHPELSHFNGLQLIKNFLNK